MTPERYRQIGELVHAAVALAPEQRPAFLSEACTGDEALRREVESLLANESRAAGFLSTVALAGGLMTAPALVGRQLGPYTIQAPLGAGSMGEVYRARDRTLGRDVAIKILPRLFATDPGRLARFERESRLLASLNHPHIGAIYGVEALDGTPALILELVEGDTLAERIAKGPISIGEALQIARQLADGLEAAHEKGIIHRDLKPANIKITTDGVVKILDFGLAKAASGDDSGPDLTHSPTLTIGGTHDGAVLGTAAYMSPEQTRGKPVDKRTDLWSFGCVLYEMLMSRPAFASDTISDTVARILEQDPDWRALPRSTPPSVVRLLQRCLDKEPKRRLHDIADARLEIDDVLSGVTPTPAEAAVVDRHLVRLPWTIAVLASLVALIAAAAFTWYIRTARQTQNAPPRISRMTIASSGAAAIAVPSPARSLAITPNGTRVVYMGNEGTRLLVHALDRLEPVMIASAVAPLNSVFVSPDGQWVGFGEGGTLKKVALTGGPVETIHTEGGGHATWAQDDTIIFAELGPKPGLQRVSVAGGEVTVLTQPVRERGEREHLFPEMLPGDRGVLFTITAISGGPDAAQVAVLDLATGRYKILVRGGSHAHYVSNGVGLPKRSEREGGWLVYSAVGALHAVMFDLDRLEPRGTPVPVLSGLYTDSQGAGAFDVTADGTLVYVDAPGAAASSDRTLVWVDRQGREEPLNVPPHPYLHPRLSPDGTQVAVAIADQTAAIWVWDLARQTLSQRTFGQGVDFSPVWTKDGSRLLFRRTAGLFWQAADGTGTAEKLATGLPTGVTPDGTQVLISSVPGGRDVMVLGLDGTSHPVALIQTSANERNGVVSQDGRWLAYESDTSGQFEIYVVPFPNVNAGTWRISTAGGTRPLWASKGDHELFYVAPDGALMAVRVDGRGATWTAGVPAKIIEGSYLTGNPGSGRNYDVASDGKRFLMVKQAPAGQAAVGKIIVVQNWVEELKRLVPTR